GGATSGKATIQPFLLAPILNAHVLPINVELDFDKFGSTTPLNYVINGPYMVSGKERFIQSDSAQRTTSTQHLNLTVFGGGLLIAGSGSLSSSSDLTLSFSGDSSISGPVSLAAN